MNEKNTEKVIDNSNQDLVKINNLSPNWGIMLTIQSNLNLRIGTQSWKKYLSAAFWNYISTPINFTITLFTALSAGQTGTQGTFLTQNQLFYILLVSFLLSIVNTFFKLKDKAILNYDASKIYDEFGAKFEKIYYMPITNNAHVDIKLTEYLKLQDEFNTYSQKENIENVNYLTEALYILTKHFCFWNKLKRLNIDERFWYLDGLPYTNDRKYNNYIVKLDDYLSNPPKVVYTGYNYDDKHNEQKHIYDRLKFDNPFYPSISYTVEYPGITDIDNIPFDIENGNFSQLRQAKQEDLHSDDGHNEYEYGNKPSRFNMFNSIRNLNKVNFDNKDDDSDVLGI